MVVAGLVVVLSCGSRYRAAAAYPLSGCWFQAGRQVEGRLVLARRQCEVEVTLTSYRIELGGVEGEKERERERKKEKTEKEKEGSEEIRREAEESTASKKRSKALPLSGGEAASLQEAA